jgi:hypothetical protein
VSLREEGEYGQRKASNTHFTEFREGKKENVELMENR